MLKKFVKYGLIVFIVLVVVSALIAENGNQDTEVQAEKEEAEELIYSDKGLMNIEGLANHDSGDFREFFVEKWNYVVKSIQDDLDHVSDAQIDDNWWNTIELSTRDFDKRDAQGWQGTGGGVYDVEFGTNIIVEMTISNPPMQELGDDPDLSKFRLSVGMDEDITEIDSKNKFLGRRRQAVQVMDVALRTVKGKGNYDRDALYKFVADFEDTGWNLDRSPLDFEHYDWGYLAEYFYDDYDIGIEVADDGYSFFDLIIDFELQ